MAQSQAAYFGWMETLTIRTGLMSKNPEAHLAEKRIWEAPRQAEFDAIEQAAEMVDRFNCIFLRTLRALRDLRRYAPVIVVQNAGQVNIGQHQVNVGGSSKT